MRAGRKRWYGNVLSIPEGVSGDVRIKHRVDPAGTVLRSGNMRTEVFGQRSEAVVLTEPTTWHTLSEKSYGVWMTDLPIEQRQTDELIKNATGRVLVGGLGLGYAVVALAHRPRVKEIIVVERSQDIANLVWEATLAKVPQPSKLTLVTADLFDYLKRREPFFQWGLFDIWQSDGEHTFHETVVPLRQLAHGMVRTLECWNENTIMRGQLLLGLRTRLLFLASTENRAEMLDMLLHDTDDSIYRRWALPFWRWYADYSTREDVDDDLVTDVAMRYVADYGRPERDNGTMILRLASEWAAA